MEKDHYIADIPQKMLLEHEGGVLLVKDDSGQWELPGGRLGNSEEPVEGLKREIKEELSIDIEPTRIFGTFVFQSPKTNHYVVVYLCKLISDLKELKIDGSEIVDMKWITEADLAQISLGKEYTRKILREFFDRVKDES